MENSPPFDLPVSVPPIERCAALQDKFIAQQIPPARAADQLAGRRRNWILGGVWIKN